MRKLSFEEIVKTRPGLDEIERQGRFPIFVAHHHVMKFLKPPWEQNIVCHGNTKNLLLR